jgi:polar amino acid transport system substrate-binding protein
MKKLLMTCFLLLSVFGVVAVFPFTQAYSMELIFACEDKQDFPNNMGNTDQVLNENPGMAIEAVRILEEKLDVKIVIKRFPWKRCLDQLEKGKLDGAFLASYKEERKQYGKFPEKDGNIDPSRRFTTTTYSLYRLKGSDVGFDGTNFINITGKVGAPLGYSIVDDLKKKGLTVDESPSTQNDFQKMIKGRLQAVAALQLTGDYYLKADNELNQKIEKVTPSIVEKPYYFMISHQFYGKNPQLAEKIFDTIAVIREDPEFQKKLKNYIK